jgi:predicted O-linked N-acetylglucosamine transferase (SPINDLY family)
MNNSQKIQELTRLYKESKRHTDESLAAEIKQKTQQIYLSLIDSVVMMSEKEIDELAITYCNLVDIDSASAMITHLLPTALTKKYIVIMKILDYNPLFISYVDKKDQTLGMAKKVYKNSGALWLNFLRPALRDQVCPDFEQSYQQQVRSWNQKIVVPEGFSIFDA